MGDEDEDEDGAFDPDLAYRVRQAVGPWINRTAELLGQPAYEMRPVEYAGTVHAPMAALKTELRAAGFTWGPFSLFHRPPVGDDPDGSWEYRDGQLAERQLHAILCRRSPERIDVYAHAEYNWQRHPLRHARHEDIDREGGATEMRRFLAESDLDHRVESDLRRRLARALDELRSLEDRLAEWRSEDAGDD